MDSTTEVTPLAVPLSLYLVLIFLIKLHSSVIVHGLGLVLLVAILHLVDFIL